MTVIKRNKYKKPAMLITCIALLVFCYTSVNAQKLFFVSAHATGAKPSGKGLLGQSDFGLGGEVVGGIKIMRKTYATGTLGYSYFFPKHLFKDDGGLNYVPVRFGIRQNFLPLNVLYLHADAGPASLKNKAISGSRVTASFGAGAKLGPIEAQLDYELIGKKHTDPPGDHGWVAFKLGYRFGL